jgi:DNA-binding NtrC family response regulator
VTEAAKVLVVEDDPLILRATADILSGDGYEVSQAETCEEAIAHLESAPDTAVLVTDLNLTCEGEGISLATLAAERWPHMRIVLVSGEMRPPSGTYPERAIFFTKPYPPGALLTVMKSPDFA